MFFSSYQSIATALHVASGKGHHDVVQTLLGAGAGVYRTSNVSDVYMWRDELTKGVMGCALISVWSTPN